MVLEPVKEVAQPWGRVVMKTGGEGTGHRGQGAGKPAPRGCPSVAFRSCLGKAGRTWVTVWQGEVCREKSVRCESRRVKRGPVGILLCVSDDKATLAVRGAVPQNSPRACALRRAAGGWPSHPLAVPSRSCVWAFRPAWKRRAGGLQGRHSPVN